MNESCLQNVLDQAKADRSCCHLGAVSVQGLAERERRFFTSRMPWAVAAIAVCHHVTTMDEWTWYQPAHGTERCDADDHVREVCDDLAERLNRRGFQTRIVDYPGESGLQFRFVAQAAGLGRIGRNAFLLHPEWGPWVHLRGLGTAAPFEEPASPGLVEVCTECHRCVDECPAGAITENGFEGLQCRAYRRERGEYEPVGDERVYRWCVLCAQACPIGDRPKPASPWSAP